MIWTLIFQPLNILISTICGALPSNISMAYDMSILITYLRKGLYFTDSSVFVTCVSVFITIETYMFAWNVIKFVYSKIPFLNIR